MASGRPVIAYGEGGVLESVVEGQTGFFFREQTPESLATAVRDFEALSIDAQACRLRAEQFSRKHFRSEMQRMIESVGGHA